MKLWTKISLLAALNIGLLALVMFVFVRIQLSNEFDSFLLAAARDKIHGISTQLALDLRDSDPAQWNAVLNAYTSAYGVTFLLYGPNLTRLAGPLLTLPPEIETRFRPAGGAGPSGPRGGGPGARGPGGQRGQASVRRPPPPPFLITSESSIPYWVGQGFSLELPSEPETVQALLLLASDSLLMNPFFFNWKSWAGVLTGVLIVSAICWLPLMRGLTHSIAQMTRATAEIAEGRFDVGLKLQRGDELGHLATSINKMASRLETFTRGQKRFLGDVAHELRSPIGRMQLAVGILERKASLELEDLKEDIEMMARLTDGLLQAAKAGVRPESLILEQTDIAAVVQTAVRHEVPKGLSIDLDVDPSIRAQANADYLLTALSNVIRNAIRYAGGAGPIRIAAHVEKDKVLITVADAGPGVPEDALDKIFTPFYRLDVSRTSQTGGTGLGLAIVRSSIEACGGSVEARNLQPGGLEVLITLAG